MLAQKSTYFLCRPYYAMLLSVFVLLLRLQLQRNIRPVLLQYIVGLFGAYAAFLSLIYYKKCTITTLLYYLSVLLLQIYNNIAKQAYGVYTLVAQIKMLKQMSYNLDEVTFSRDIPEGMKPRAAWMINAIKFTN